MTRPVCCPGLPIESCLGRLASIKDPEPIPAAELAAHEPCTLGRLKRRLIGIERGAVEHWPHLREEVAAHAELIAVHASTRWLLAVLEAFVDHGSPLERSHAMTVSVLVNWERLALTERLALGALDGPVRRASHAMHVPQPLWDGAESMVLTSGADLLPPLFRRLDRVLAETPLLHRFFVAIVTRMLEHERSTIRRLEARSERVLTADVRRCLSHSPSRYDDARPAEPSSRIPNLGEEEFRRVVLEALQSLTGGLTAVLQRQEGHAEQTSQNTQSLVRALEGVALAFERVASERFNRSPQDHEVKALVSRPGVSAG